MREHLSDVESDQGTSVVLFGSWGRQELTNHSDDDWAILVDGAEGPGVRPSPSQIGGLIGEERKPGTQGIFGDVIFSYHLVKRIGLDADDNKNLTRRLLLLLESVAVVNESAHRDCWLRVLEGYLDDSVKSYRPPRFLLNDLIRYWRTICVDFVGKEREGAGQKWALRNLKLRLSRKALFVGMLGDQEAREELERVSRDEAGDSSAFEEGRRLGADFQQGLLALLFETRLERMVREYGIF